MDTINVVGADTRIIINTIIIRQLPLTVIKIKEHRAEGEGDKWYYDVFLSDGTMERIFNPNVVVFDNEDGTK